MRSRDTRRTYGGGSCERLAWSPRHLLGRLGSTDRSGAKYEIQKEGASVETRAGIVIYTVDTIVPNAEGFTLVTDDAGLWTGETAEVDLGI